MNYKNIINESYMSSWDDMYERLKRYKKEFGRTTVSRNYSDKSLYTWFRKQKLLYKSIDVEMPEEHFEKLQSIDFYFGDGHKEREAIIEKKWLDLLMEALDEGEDVRANHRYRYKGHGLGTFLVGISKKNKQGKKLDTKLKIEQIGFDYHKTERTPVATAERFLNALLTNKKKHKGNFQTYFNKLIREKKELFSEEIVEKINETWYLRFNEKRTWKKITRKKTTRDLSARFIKDFTEDSIEQKPKYVARFRHSIHPRAYTFSPDLIKKISKEWQKKYKEELDWDIKVIKKTPNNNAKRFIYDLMTRPSLGKPRFLQRFRRTIVPKKEGISENLIKEINKTWKWRYEEELNWNIIYFSTNPEDIVLRFLNKLRNNTNLRRHLCRINFHRTIVPKKDVISNEIIENIN